MPKENALRLDKVGIIRNELPFWGFYGCLISGESLTNITQSPSGFIPFVSDLPAFTHG